MSVLHAFGSLLGFAIMSCAGVIASFGIAIAARQHDNTHGSILNYVALAAVILGNAWFLWVSVLQPSHYLYADLAAHGARYQQLWRMGVYTTIVTLPLAVMGKGLARLCAIAGAVALLVLWGTVSA